MNPGSSGRSWSWPPQPHLSKSPTQQSVSVGLPSRIAQQFPDSRRRLTQAAAPSPASPPATSATPSPPHSPSAGACMVAPAPQWPPPIEAVTKVNVVVPLCSQSQSTRGSGLRSRRICHRRLHRHRHQEQEQRENYSLSSSLVSPPSRRSRETFSSAPTTLSPSSSSFTSSSSSSPIVFGRRVGLG